MNINEEPSLAVSAHNQIALCCETLCEKSIVKEYILHLEDTIKEMQKYINEMNECGMSRK